MSTEPYSHPTRYCDVVMKGGITSGVVYPLAVCELARTYQLKNIGGTSAGAIAAAAAAAAEYGRRRGGASFAELEKLPQWLGGRAPGGQGSNLFALFQPEEETRPLYDTLVAGIGHRGWKPVRVFAAALRAFPLAALLGAAPGLLLIWLVFRSSNGALFAWGLISGAVLMLGGMVVAAALSFARRTIRALPRNLYGLCSGLGEEPPSGPPALTVWLSDYLDRLAGRKPEEGPLTFGDLWGTRDPAGERQINLEMMTVSLTHGRPYRLPFETNVFYFKPEEFRRLFPERVVRWMEEHARDIGESSRFARLGLRAWPEAADVPIVVAARMSLSFPFLISAVPLHAINYNRAIEPDQRRPERCWFSDGGACSNFPVHFFDAPLPRWPTFAINLRPVHPDRMTPVWMPTSNTGGILDWWTDLEAGSGLDKLTDFYHAIINAMQNWMDNTQTQLPGYRDRVVHISLSPEEGGMNLNMPPHVIAGLSERGRQAGAELVKRFASEDPGCELTWDNHRWVRYRSTMAVWEDLLKRFRRGFYPPLFGERSYEDLVLRAKDEPPASYRWSRQIQRDFADRATRELVEMAEAWTQSGETFREEAPSPMPELRVRPRI